MYIVGRRLFYVRYENSWPAPTLRALVNLLLSKTLPRSVSLRESVTHSSHFSSFAIALEMLISSNCTAEEQAAAIALQNALCAGVAGPSGVTVSIPAGSASAAVDPSLLSSVAAGVTGSGMASMASMSSMASMTAMSSAPAASVTSALVASNSAAASRVSSAAASAVSNASSRAASAASGASSLAASARPSGAANKVANVGTFVGAAGVVAGALFAL